MSERFGSSTQQRVAKNTPPPLGYDPQIIWQAGVEDPTYGLPPPPGRIELYALARVMTQEPPKIWRAPKT